VHLLKLRRLNGQSALKSGCGEHSFGGMIGYWDLIACQNRLFMTLTLITQGIFHPYRLGLFTYDKSGLLATLRVHRL
jgi:hypothetical protein